MRYAIASDIPGRLRVRLLVECLSVGEARGIESRLREVQGVLRVSAHAANGSVLVCYDTAQLVRPCLIAAIRELDILALPVEETPSDQVDLALAEEQDRFRLEVGLLFAWSLLRRLLPTPVRTVVTIARSMAYVREGLCQLVRGQLTVEVLDATAIAMSIARGNPSEADVIMLLLGVSDAMERHVQSRARLSLEQGLVSRSSHVWRLTDEDDEFVALDSVATGDLIRLRTGSTVPVDGRVEQGVAELNEATMTGESELVRKEPESSVFAGTAVERGELVVRVMTPPGSARIDAIATMVDRAADLKSSSQSKVEELADRLVPAAFFAFLGILVVTRNMDKALAVLMVDYSCALRLSTPIAVMSALREAAEYDVVVKGGKYLEALAEADTVVFDKTGTLTQAAPRLSGVVSVGDVSEDEILRLAACIEEHFPHAVAHAIVEAAREHGLSHEPELHAEVRYIVAHGIAARVDGKHTIIGSAHFVFEDENVHEPDGFEERIDEVAQGSGHIYLAHDGRLLGALCVQDPLRAGVRETLDKLRALDVERVVMLTGDVDRAARATAAAAGIEEYQAQVLPEDKASFVADTEAKGHRTIMVGDGVNDTPALAAASVSVALADASDIARTVADISIRSDSLDRVVVARELSKRLQRRIASRYRLIVGINTTLIALGIASVLPLTTAATLHNLSTVAIAASNTRPLLKRS